MANSRASDEQISARSFADPILPSLRLVADILDEIAKDPNNYNWDYFSSLLKEIIDKFGDMECYKYDKRLLKIWILYADAIQDFSKIYKILENKGQFVNEPMLYERYAIFLISKRDLLEAYHICKLGISRCVEPPDFLKLIYQQLCDKCPDVFNNLEKANVCENLENLDIANNLENPDTKVNESNNLINPWSVRNDLLKKLNEDMKKYPGFYKSNKAYTGKVSLTSLNNNLRNKVVELGHYKYQIKGCCGKGGLAKVFKACDDTNPHQILALKIQKPAFPWELYMYRQLDNRIFGIERSNFGYAHRMHVYSDLSILVCDYLSHGTLQDAINLHLVTKQHMDEVLCVYYTIQMLHILEILHKVEILHGDFKPDNIIVRYPKEELTRDMIKEQNGSWLNQGLCLVDWGRGIDVSLFSKNTLFIGDCKTSGFSCVQMQQNKPWKYQADTYGLCVVVHMMLHGSYMKIETKINPDGTQINQPTTSLKRYWNVELWKKLFSTLLNMENSDENDVLNLLKRLKESFVEYLCSNKQLVVKLNQLLAKQKGSLCSN